MGMTRRQFTSTLASAALLAPLMHIRSARAASSPINKLLILGTISPVRPNWNLADPNSFLFGAAMSAIKDKTILLDGLPQNDPTANHGHPGALTGMGFGQATNSFDVAIARGMGGSYAIPNLVLGAGGKAGDSTYFWQDKTQVTPISDPNTAFKLAFGSNGSTTSAMPSTGGGNASGLDPATQMRRRTAILDLLADDITALEAQNLNDADQAKMIAHRQSAEQLRSRLAGSSSSGNGGNGGSGSTCSPALGQFDPSNFSNENATLLQIGTEALICGVTPVVAVAFGTQQGYTATSYDPAGPTFNGDTHNTFVHGGGPNPFNAPYETWCAAQFANAVNSLAKAPGSAGGTMLDETIVLWTRDMGDGLAHNSQKMPYVIAGGKSYFGYSASGHVLDLSASLQGRTHEGLLRTIAAAMGVTQLAGFGANLSAALISEIKQ